MRKLNQVISLFVFFLTGCQFSHISVQQEWINQCFLASSYVESPDPRNEDPPIGTRLIVSWNFPFVIYEEKLTMKLTVRLWDNTQKIIHYPIKKSKGYDTFFFPDKCENLSKTILTYLIEVYNKDGECVDVWKHQLWTELIDIDK